MSCYNESDRKDKSEKKREECTWPVLPQPDNYYYRHGFINELILFKYNISRGFEYPLPSSSMKKSVSSEMK